MNKKYVNQIAYEIVGCAFEVHKNLGLGLLESVYEVCLVDELKQKGLQIKQQVQIPIIYKGKQLDANLRIDLLVNNLIIVELKAVEIMIPLFKAQLLTYLKLTNFPKGLLINFNSTSLRDKEQLIPMVTDVFAKLPDE